MAKCSFGTKGPQVGTKARRFGTEAHRMAIIAYAAHYLNHYRALNKTKQITTN